MKHCLTFSCEQPTIPYRNRNSTEFLYLFILVYATEIINNDYNKVSLDGGMGWQFHPLTKQKHLCRAKLERKRAIVCSVKNIFGILSPY